LARICLHIGATGLCFEHRPLEPILRSWVSPPAL
jgi:hypothetical protein